MENPAHLLSEQEAPSEPGAKAPASCSRPEEDGAAATHSIWVPVPPDFQPWKNLFVFLRSKVPPGSQKEGLFPLSQPSFLDSCPTFNSSVQPPVPNTSPSCWQNSQNPCSSRRCYQKLSQGHSWDSLRSEILPPSAMTHRPLEDTEGGIGKKNRDLQGTSHLNCDDGLLMNKNQREIGICRGKRRERYEKEIKL